MSYAIQNYYRPSVTLRLTYRRYHLWLLANAPRMLLLFSHLSKHDYWLHLDQTFLQRPAHFFRLIFSKGMLRFFTKSTLKWRPIVGSQFIQGLEYWAYKTNLQIVENNLPKHSPSLSFTPTYFLNQVRLEKNYTNITLSQKYYRIVLINFLYLSVRSWQVYRPYFRLPLNLFFVSKDLYLLKYFNTRIFRVLSV
jgi:hypothetical protein